MLISKSLSQKLRHSASILLRDGTDETGAPKIVVRQVTSAWGRFEPTGSKGGICFPALSDGTVRITYDNILGYHIGTDASIQPLILKESVWRLRMPYKEWQDFLRRAAEMLLASRPDTRRSLTVSKLTIVNYRFNDKWYGHGLHFVRLRDAKKAAQKQIGESVAIYSCKTGNIVCFTPASGYCPP